jgi:sugar phosphate isomerase/epimerase
MKLSCLPVSLFGLITSGKMQIQEWAEFAAAVGLDGVDLSILFLQQRTRSYIATTRRKIEETGVHIAMVTTYPDFTRPSKASRAKEFANCMQDIRIAEELGAEFVRVTAGQAHPRVKREDGIKWATEALVKLCELTRAQYDVQLVFENHSKPGVWKYKDFSHPTDVFLEIVRRTKSAGLKVNWDTANTLVYGDDPLFVLARVIDDVVSVHVSDTAGGGELKPVLIGTGVVPLRETFAMLKRAAFDGWLCIEEASGSGKQGIRSAVEYVRATWANT